MFRIDNRMARSHFYLFCFFYNCIVSTSIASHHDLRKDLAALRNIVVGADGKLDKMFGVEEKIQDIQISLNTLLSKMEEFNRKSLLLREIHQDNDGRNEMLQRILKGIDEINRKQSAAAGRKHRSEIERLDKLAENIQVLFQIFGSISRKLDDFHIRIEQISNTCSSNDIKVILSKKLDLILSSATSLSDCIQCNSQHSLKDIVHSSLWQSLESVSKKICTSNELEKSTWRHVESKLGNFLDTLQNDINFKFRKFGHQLEGVKQECRNSDDMKHAKKHSLYGDMEYSHDPPQDSKTHKTPVDDSGTPRETPGRIFRKLWRKMTEPINKVGDKIDNLGQMMEVSHQKHHNQTVSKMLELTHKTDETDSCIKQVQLLSTSAKDTVQKLGIIESRQVAVQNMCTKILMELQKTKSTLNGGEEEITKVTSVTQSTKVGTGVFNGSSKEGIKLATNCAELQQEGIMKNGIYSIKPVNSSEEFLAFCDMETDGGGWTVIQRRGDFGEIRQNFTQGWEMYKKGFGDMQKEFWLGNEKLHLLSVQEPTKLRVELEDFDGNSAFAEYSRFRVEDEGHQYRLSVGDYQGNATDSLSLHDAKLFSTEDRDNDEVSSCCNCADTFKGGWWYYRCFEANLNGPYHTVPTENGYFLGIIWERWKGDYSLKSSEMKLRALRYDLQDP